MAAPSITDLLLKEIRTVAQLEALHLANECQTLEEFRQRFQALIDPQQNEQIKEQNGAPDEEATTKELDQLSDWLKAQGMTPAQVLDCFHYIAGAEDQIDSEK